MDLVHEEYGTLSVQIQPLLGFLDFVTQLLDSGQNRVYGGEMAFRGVGDHSCKGCLPRSRRAVEDDGRQLVRLYGSSKKPSRANDMVLAYILVKGPWPHSIGKRLGFGFNA